MLENVYKYDDRHNIMTCVIRAMEETFLKKAYFPFSPNEANKDDKASVTHVSLNEQLTSREFAGDPLWLSRKMINDGGTLEQALQVMEERCKDCSVVSPMFCVEQCETWKVKKELRETNRVLSGEDHGEKLMNAIKNKRRLAVIDILQERKLSLHNLQKKLKRYGFYHSQKTISGYLQPLSETGLVIRSDKDLELTLYGKKIREAIIRHGYTGQLPIHSNSYEEKILRILLLSAKTRNELLDIVPTKGLSRVLKRLLDRGLILSSSPSNRVFYFRTRRALSLEKLSPTHKRICAAIPEAGISTRELSRSIGINIRRTYKYLRSLRGKKLVFRRKIPIKFELSVEGRRLAEFLDEITSIT
jgi:predicted transcriptional regulator